MVEERQLKEFHLDESTFIGGWYIDSQLCDEIIEYYNSNIKYAEAGGLGVNTEKEPNNHHINKDIKDSLDLMVGPKNFDLCFRNYRRQLQTVLENYLNKYPWANKVFPFNITKDYNIQKYSKSGGFKEWHIENSQYSGNEKRHLVFMTYLNDVKNGGTEFLHQNLTTPAEKGLTLIWPAGWTHPHKGQISSQKEKYIVTGWYEFLDDDN